MIDLGFFPQTQKPLAPKQEIYFYYSSLFLGMLLFIVLICFLIVFSKKPNFSNPLLDNFYRLCWFAIAIFLSLVVYRLLPFWQMNRHVMHRFANLETQPWQLVAIPSHQWQYKKIASSSPVALLFALITLLKPFSNAAYRTNFKQAKHFSLIIKLNNKMHSWYFHPLPWIIQNTSGDYFLVAANVPNSTVPLILTHELSLIQGLCAHERDNIKKRLITQFAAQGFSMLSQKEDYARLYEYLNNSG